METGKIIIYKKWDARLIESSHGPKNSNYILTDIYLKKTNERQRLIIKDIVGEILIFPNERRILACQSNSTVNTKGAILFDIQGKRLGEFKHRGFQRGCWKLEKHDIFILHYNSVLNGKPINKVLVVNSDGIVILEKHTIQAQKIRFDYQNRKHVLEVPEPEFPG